MDGIDINWLGGNCPVQSEGTVDGKAFYFRARGEHWRIEIHPTARSSYVGWPDDVKTWEYGERWGDGPYAAGWMPEDVARQMITKAVALYRASRTDSKEG